MKGLRARPFCLQDDQGRWVYFPYGSISQGYLVESPEAAASMEPSTPISFMVALAVVAVVISLVADQGFIAVLIVFAGIFAQRHYVLRERLARLQLSDYRMSFTNEMRQMPQSMPIWATLFFLAIGIFGLALPFALMLFGPRSWSDIDIVLVVVSALICAFALAVLVQQLRTRSGKRS